MSNEHIQRNDKGHLLVEKSQPVEYRLASVDHVGIVMPVAPEWHVEDEPLQVPKPHGDFRIAKVGESAPHDIGCNCLSCVQRRRKQAQQPEFRAIIEEKAARLPAHLAAALRTAFCVAE